MKRILLFIVFIGLFGTIQGQTTKSACDEYRQIIENNIKELQMDEFGRSIIVGDHGEYINPGMSKYFMSEPKVPDYVYTKDDLDMRVIDIIIAHVDLYHCDIAEQKGIKNKEFKVASKEDRNCLKVYPNPTSGIINIEGQTGNIKQILLFNSNGKLVKRIHQIENSIDLSEFDEGTYYLYFLLQDKIQVEKIIRI